MSTTYPLTEMPESENVVNYTVKELLSRMDEKLDRLEVALRESATKADMNEIQGRVKLLEATTLDREMRLRELDKIVQGLSATSVTKDAVTKAVQTQRLATLSLTDKAVVLVFTTIMVALNILSYVHPH